MSEQQKPKSALERLETLEQVVRQVAQTTDALRKIAEVLQQRTQQADMRFANLDKGANALTQVLVESGVIQKEVLFKQIETNVLAERVAIEDSWVSSGAAVETLSVEEEGIVAISEKQPDGIVLGLREHIEVQKLNPDVKPLLLGKSVGEEIGLPNGNIVTILRAFKAAERGELGDTAMDAGLAGTPEEAVIVSATEPA